MLALSVGDDRRAATAGRMLAVGLGIGIREAATGAERAWRVNGVYKRYIVIFSVGGEKRKEKEKWWEKSLPYVLEAAGHGGPLDPLMSKEERFPAAMLG